MARAGRGLTAPSARHPSLSTQYSALVTRYAAFTTRTVTVTYRFDPAVPLPIWITSTRSRSPAATSVTSGSVVVEAFPEIAIVGRFALVVNSVVPFFITSTMKLDPVGAVVRYART